MTVFEQFYALANTLQHQCARFNLPELEKLLLAKGARPDFKSNNETPLDIALRLGNVEFAWQMVDTYQAQGIPMTEKLLFDVLAFFKRALEKMVQGDWHGARRLGFFKATHDTRFMKISAVVMSSIFLSFIFGLIWREEKRKKQIKADFLSECRQQLKIVILSDEFNQYLNNHISQIAPGIVCPFSRELLFPLCLIMSDGRAYQADYINNIFTNISKSPVSQINLVFENLRIDINLISYLKIQIKAHLTAEIEKLEKQIELYSKLPDNLTAQQMLSEVKETLEKLPSYQKELSELQYPFELFDSIDDCLCDPKTNAIMECPCIAPNGKNYDVPLPAGNPTRFEANIEGLGNKIIVYRNFELQAICDEYRKVKQIPTIYFDIQT